MKQVWKKEAGNLEGYIGRDLPGGIMKEAGDILATVPTEADDEPVLALVRLVHPPRSDEPTSPPKA